MTAMMQAVRAFLTLGPRFSFRLLLCCFSILGLCEPVVEDSHATSLLSSSFIEAHVGRMMIGSLPSKSIGQ